MAAASLRYFAREGAFARMVSAATGLELPSELRAGTMRMTPREQSP